MLTTTSGMHGGQLHGPTAPHINHDNAFCSRDEHTKSQLPAIHHNAAVDYDSSDVSRHAEVT
jgi:hypothetical protein